jgi:hypothetical protein
MRRPVALILLVLLLPLPFAAYGQQPDDFSLNIALTRGERSRDSHSQTTRITLKGDELTYEKSYRGARGAKSVPVKKSFKIRTEDRERLKKLVRDNGLLSSVAAAVADEGTGVRRYFNISLDISLDGKKSGIEVSGPRSAVEIKEQKAYQKASALLAAVYQILSGQDREIPDESRDLIEGAR